MATAKPLSSRKPRRAKRLVWLAVLAAAVLIAVFGSTLRSYAVAGASVGARVACSCRYVAGRDLSECRGDFEPGMGLIVLTQDEAAKSVTARFPLLARETAFFRPGEGCALEKWPD